jgi:hypothetical protein
VSSADDPARCVILVPAYQEIEPECERSLSELEDRGYTVRRTSGFSAVDSARNQMASIALGDGFDELMWIDSDHGFSPDDVDRLRAHDLPICSGLYAKKGQRSIASRFLPGTASITFGRGGGLIEIKYAGFGFVHTRREVYEAIQRTENLPVCNEIFNSPNVPYFMPMLVPDRIGHTYLAEDYSFCERARRAGFTIMADTRLRIWHLGRYLYGWEDAGRDIERFSNYTFTVLSSERNSDLEPQSGLEPVPAAVPLTPGAAPAPDLPAHAGGAVKAKSRSRGPAQPRRRVKRTR